jgi:hypothetical protein
VKQLKQHGKSAGGAYVSMHSFVAAADQLEGKLDAKMCAEKHSRHVTARANWQ